MGSRFNDALAALETHKAHFRAAAQRATSAAQAVYSTTAAELMDYIMKGDLVQATALMRRAKKELPLLMNELNKMGLSISTETLEQRLLGNGESSVLALPEQSGDRSDAPSKPTSRNASPLPSKGYTSLISLVTEVNGGTQGLAGALSYVRKEADTDQFLSTHRRERAKGFEYLNTPRVRSAIKKILKGRESGTEAEEKATTSNTSATSKRKEEYLNLRGLVCSFEFPRGKQQEATKWLREHAKTDPFLQRHGKQKGVGKVYANNTEVHSYLEQVFTRQGYFTEGGLSLAPTAAQPGSRVYRALDTLLETLPGGNLSQPKYARVAAHARTDEYLLQHARRRGKGFHFADTPEVRAYLTEHLAAWQQGETKSDRQEAPITPPPARSALPGSPPIPVRPTYSETSQPYSAFTIATSKLKGKGIPLGFVDAQCNVLGLHTGPGNIQCYDPTKLHEIQRLWDTEKGEEYRRTH